MMKKGGRKELGRELSNDDKYSPEFTRELTMQLY